MPPAEKKEPGEVSANNTINSNQETVIIFDWDDTLLASSYLSSKGYRLDGVVERSVEVDLQLSELEQSVSNLINLALTFGRVHIITNAETGWVQLSAQKFIPGVVPLLSKVKVLSARSTYENMFPESPLKWKYYAFHENLSKPFESSEFSKLDRNVISFGDSHVEREAVRAVTRGLPNTRTKSVKFAERPSLEQLRREIELVINCLNYIIGHDGDLDLQLTVTVNNETPATPTGSTNSSDFPTSDYNNNELTESATSCHKDACATSPMFEKEAVEELVRS